MTYTRNNASRYIGRSQKAVKTARQAKCDHDYRLSEAGRTRGAMVCTVCGHVMPNKGSSHD